MHNEETLAIGTAMPIDHEGPEVKSQTLTKGLNVSIITDPRPDVTSAGETAHLANLRRLLTSGDIEVNHQFGDKWSPHMYVIEVNDRDTMVPVYAFPHDGRVRLPLPYTWRVESPVSEAHMHLAREIAQAVSVDVDAFIRLVPTLGIPYTHSDSDGTLVDPDEFTAQLIRGAELDTWYANGVVVQPKVAAPAELDHVAGIREIIAELSETCEVSLTQFVSDVDLYAALEICTPLKFLSIDFSYADDARTYEIAGVDGIDISELVEHLANIERFKQLVNLLQVEATTEDAVRVLAEIVPFGEPYETGLALKHLREAAGVPFDSLAESIKITGRALAAVEAGTAVFEQQDCAEFAQHVVLLARKNTLSTTAVQA